jgi:CBS domain containing-hemolysin-like protein
MLLLSVFEGETLDTVANVIAWLVLILVPIIGIAVFWLVHILPEKIAEKKHHPQAKAIQTLCLLSLVFGGLLWPLAWLWAYSKPVLYKMAYGTDVDEHGHGSTAAAPADSAAAVEDLRRARERLSALPINASENPQLAATIRQISELEEQLAAGTVVGEGRA